MLEERYDFVDPLSPKNMPLPDETARRILEWIGVPLDRPLVTQVSRFDPWKDPLGVIEAYRLARKEVPGLQLALVGSMALDDPEGWTIYRSVKIPLQMADGVGGLLVSSAEECAAALVELLTDRKRAGELARLGQERVRQHFLLPRLLLDELTLMRGLAAGRPIERDASWFATHDPVCGMSVAEAGEAVGDVVLGGKTLRFCSEACRRQFTAAPGHYIGS